jgi:hypothetical protein
MKTSQKFLDSGLGSERFDHQQNYPEGGAGEEQSPSASPGKDGSGQRPCYYCRGCGCALPSDFHGHFHKECLRADKRRRVRVRRKGEQARFEHWLQKQHCHNCGARYAEMRSDSFPEGSCEASQGATYPPADDPNTWPTGKTTETANMQTAKSGALAEHGLKEPLLTPSD